MSAYETHQTAAAHFSATAHQHTAKSSAHGADGHGKTALAHKKAADAHREAAKYAPEDWMKKGHEDQAKLHDHYAQAHGKHAAAAGSKGDTGVDTPIHATEHLTALEDHDDYSGFGYLGHSSRDAGTDKALVEAANKAGVDKHTLQAHLLSKSGRHMMDSLPGKSMLDEGGDGEHEERVAHFHRWLTSDKHNKTYGIKEYAKDLKNKDASAKGEDLPDAQVQHKGVVSTVEFGNGAGRAVLHPEHREVLGKMKDGDTDTIHDEQGYKWKAERKGGHIHFTEASGKSGLKGKVKVEHFQPFPGKK